MISSKRKILLAAALSLAIIAGFLNTPQVMAFVFGSEGDVSFWSRSSTTLSPKTAGDSLNMGIGAITTTGTLQAEQLTSTDDATIQDTLSVDGTMTLSTGSIVDTTGAISFGDENLSTTGTLGAGAITGTSLTATSSTGAILGTDAATNTAGTLKFWSAGANNFYSTFTAGTQTASADYTLPTAMATANSQALLGSTAGVLSWGTDFGANNITTTGTVSAEQINSTDDADIAGTLTAGDLVTDTGGLTILAGQAIRPSVDSTTSLGIANAAGTNFAIFDSTYGRVGIGTTAPAVKLAIGDPSSDFTTFFTASGTENEGMIISGAFGAGARGIGCMNTSPSGASTGGGFAMFGAYDGAAMASGDRLGGMTWGGSTGQTGTASYKAPTAILSFAGENWVYNTNFGSDMRLAITKNGAINRTNLIFLSPVAGYVSIGTAGLLIPAAQLHQDSGTGVASYHKFTAGTTTLQTATDGFNIGITSAGYGQLINYEAYPLTIARGVIDVTDPTWTTADVLVVKNLNAQNAVIQILTANNKIGTYQFSDADARNRGGLTYTHSTDTIQLYAASIVEFATGGELRSSIEADGDWDFVANDLTTTGAGIFSGGVTTKDNTGGAPTLTTNGQIQVGLDGTSHRLYFYENGAQYYIIGTSSFEIPGRETIDSISGEQMKIGDFVIGMLDKDVGDEESSLHGVWVKWDSVKAELIKEIQAQGLNPDGGWQSGSVSGVQTETLLEKVTNVLASLGISIKDGVTNIANLAAEKFTAKTVRIEKIEMVATNGDIYCTWIDNNGDWQKVKGDCSSAEVAAVAQNLTITPTAIVPIATTETPSASSTSPTQETLQQTQADIDAAQQADEQAQQAAQEAQSAAQEAQEATNQAQQSDEQEAQRVAKQAEQEAKQSQKEAEKAQKQVQKFPEKLDIISVTSIPDINVDYGTALASANLPTTASAILSDNSTQTVAIVWDNGMPTYDENTAGVYVFSGELTFSENITNTNNLNISVNVLVAQQPADLPAQAGNPAGAAADLIQDAASSLLNGVWNFMIWVIELPIKKLYSLPIIQEAKTSLMESADILQAGLLLPMQKILSNLLGK